MQFIDEIDWARLKHAWGVATDTPIHLKALTSPDPVLGQAAIDHLEIKVLHQGFPGTATAPATRVVARLLAEDAVVVREVRIQLVEYLGWSAGAAQTAEENNHFAHLFQPLVEAALQSFPVVMRFLEDPDASMRINAGASAVAHVDLEALADQRHILARRLLALANEQSEDRAEWLQLISEIGHRS